MKRRTPLTRRVALKPSGSKSFRQRPVDAAEKLWAILRQQKVAGLQFRYREPIGPYVVDFCCPAARLVVELVGENLEDVTRTQWLRQNGYRVLQFPQGDVLSNPSSVLEGIAAAFELRIVARKL